MDERVFPPTGFLRLGSAVRYIWWHSAVGSLIVGSSMVLSRFGDESHLAGGKCNRSIVWLGSSVVECSHGKRERVRVPVGPGSFSAPVTVPFV